MEVIKRKKSKRLFSAMAKILPILLVLYTVVMLINQYSQLKEKKAKLDEINSKIAVQKLKNDELLKIANATDEECTGYIEKVARENLNLSKKGERVFINVLGD